MRCAACGKPIVPGEVSCSACGLLVAAPGIPAGATLTPPSARPAAPTDPIGEAKAAAREIYHGTRQLARAVAKEAKSAAEDPGSAARGALDRLGREIEDTARVVRRHVRKEP